jgi:hypothetical protein
MTGDRQKALGMMMIMMMLMMSAARTKISKSRPGPDSRLPTPRSISRQRCASIFYLFDAYLFRSSEQSGVYYWIWS